MCLQSIAGSSYADRLVLPPSKCESVGNPRMLLDSLMEYEDETMAKISDGMVSDYLQYAQSGQCEVNAGCKSLCDLLEKLLDRTPVDNMTGQLDSCGLFDGMGAITRASMRAVLVCLTQVSSLMVLIAYLFKTYVTAPASSYDQHLILKPKVTRLATAIDAQSGVLLQQLSGETLCEELSCWTFEHADV